MSIGAISKLFYDICPICKSQHGACKLCVTDKIPSKILSCYNESKCHKHRRNNLTNILFHFFAMLFLCRLMNLFCDCCCLFLWLVHKFSFFSTLIFSVCLFKILSLFHKIPKKNVHTFS
jgi:hypothetical protein